MDISSLLIVLIFVLAFGLIAYFSYQSNRNQTQAKQQLAQSLGFAPFTPDSALTAKITRLYYRPGAQNRYELRSVYRKVMPDADVFLFDLLDKSSDEDSWTENQAVAICSPELHLPHFRLYPKVDNKNLLGGLANKIMAWGLSRVSEAVEFPSDLSFNARYLVHSDQPDQAYQFLSGRLASYFAQTQMFTLYAWGDVFTFSIMDLTYRSTNNNEEGISRRVKQALEIYRLFG